MGLATFRGGVHPFEGKELSMERAVTLLKPTSGEMVYPLSQHIGAPAKPLVQVGDEVLVGQKIAEAGGFISAVEGEKAGAPDDGERKQGDVHYRRE